MAKTNAREYLKRPYARVIIPDCSGGFSAQILEFPGCYAEGETQEETLRILEEVAEEWIQSEIEQGHDIPRPSDNEAFSGKFALRLPRGIHAHAARLAEREGTSLNQYFGTAIAARVGAHDLYNRIVKRLESQVLGSVLVTVNMRAITVGKEDLRIDVDNLQEIAASGKIEYTNP